MCIETCAPCPVGPLACEAARLVAARRGIEDSEPLRWRAIDRRLEAIELEAGAHRASSRQGHFLQACIGAGDATGEEARNALRQLTGSLALSTLAPLLAYYVDPRMEGPPPHDRPLPQGCPRRAGP